LGKAPAFQFYPGDWLRDTQVQMASMETRGVWFELLCNMWFAPERGKIEGEKTEICRMLGCDLEIFNKALNEIKRLKIADVTNCNKNVTIINRRMLREEKQRKSTRLRVRKHRVTQGSNTNVTHPSSTPSSPTPSSPLQYSANFLKFWKEYPRKEKKGDAFKAWKKAKDKPPIIEMIEIIKVHAQTDQWNKKNGQFIPHPASWINARQWEDEIKPNQQKDLTAWRKRISEKQP
jgi:hypothetical protein